MHSVVRKATPRCSFDETCPASEPGASRFEQWRALGLLPTTSVAFLGTRGAERFDGRLARLAVPGVGSFADISAPAIKVSRRYGMASANPAPDMQLAFVLEGAIVAEGAGEAGVTRAGGLRLVDVSPPFESRWQGRQLRLNLPRTSLAAVLGEDPGRWHRSAIPFHRLTPMLVDQLRGLARMTKVAGDETTRALALQATVDLAITVLQLELGGRRADPERAVDGLFVAACRIIDQQIDRPDLSGSEIAARLGCSRAHVYRAFARHELSVGSFIRERRLQRCRVEIESAAATPVTIADLAFSLGFHNPVHFARLFKARFGVSPRDHRRLARAAAKRG